MVRMLANQAFLDGSDRAALLALPYTTRLLDPAAYIIREGDPPVTCAVLLSGFAHRQKVTHNGARQIMSVHIPGDLLDLQQIWLDLADHSVQTLTRAEIACIPKAALRELADTRPRIGHAFLVNMMTEASIYREWLLNIGRRDARTRVAHLLCEFAVRMDVQGLKEGAGYELPMTQEQLADAVGLTPVHVNRTLKLLESEGLIHRNRRHIRFPSWDSLRRAAGFSSRYLHLGVQQGASEAAGGVRGPANDATDGARDAALFLRR